MHIYLRHLLHTPPLTGNTCWYTHTEVDTPLLRAGLMGTLHAILDEPIAAAAKATEQAQEAGILESSASSLLSSGSGTGNAAAGTATTRASVVTPPMASPSDSSSAIGKSGVERPSSPRSGAVGAVGGAGGGGWGGGGRGIGGVEGLDAKKVVAMTQNAKKNRERLLRSSPDVLDRILAVRERESEVNASRVYVSRLLSFQG